MFIIFKIYILNFTYKHFRFDGGQIAIQASKINLIDRLSISNSTQSLTVTDSSITNITNSVFMSNGNMQIASSTCKFIQFRIIYLK